MPRSTQSYQLLIADDDEQFRETLSSIFQPHFSLHQASSGEEAVDIIEHKHIDIALLDMHMEELTGLETFQLLKQANATAPGILITADITTELVQSAHDIKIYSVLGKPVTRSQLVTTVSTAIQETYDNTFFISALG